MNDRRRLQKSLRTDLSPNMRVRLSRARFRLRQAAHVPGLALGKHLEKPIFIVGAPRSGTSVLFKVLMSSPGLAHWPGEAHEVWERDHHPALRGWDSNVLQAEDLDPASAAHIRRNFYLVTGPRKRLIDKTPRNSFRLSFVDALFPDARYVVLQRDGRENVNSLITAWRTKRYRTYRLPSPHAIPGVPDPNWWKFVLYPGWRRDVAGPLEVVCARQWSDSNEAILKDIAGVAADRWTTLRYEDFVARPVEEVERLAGFLGIPSDEHLGARARSVTTTPVNIVTPPEPGKWKKENPTEVASIESLIEPTMRKLGYSDP